MKTSFSKPSPVTTTLFFLGLCVLSAIPAVILGIDDNMPGILLAFFAAICFILSFAHAWQTARQFLFLVLGAVILLVLFIYLNITVDSILQDPAGSSSLRGFLDSPAFDAFNIIISMLCMAGLTVGVIGSMVVSIRNRRRNGRN